MSKPMIDVHTIQDMQSKYDQGWSFVDIARDHGVSATAVKNVLKTDVTKTLVYKNGDRDKVRQMYADGMSLRKISKELGYSYNTIRCQFSWDEILEVNCIPPDEITRIRKLSHKGWSVRKIINYCKRDRATIKKYLGDTGPYNKTSSDEIERIRYLESRGWTVTAIAKEVNRSYDTVRKYMCQQHQSRRKVSHELAQELQAEYNAGWTIYEIAARHNLSGSTVYRNIDTQKRRHTKESTP